MTDRSAPQQDARRVDQRLGALLDLQSLALVGASERSGAHHAALLNAGAARVYPVNPRRDEVFGRRCFASVTDLPEVPEAAMLLLGHERVADALEEAALAGVRTFVVPGVGNEAGAEAKAVVAALRELAQMLDVTLVGPNCMGIALPGRPSCWIGTIPETFVDGHVSVVAQSGSIASALLTIGPRVGFRCVVSTGAEADSDAADWCALLAEDPGTRAVGVFLESVRRPEAFERGLAELAEADKRVACLKVGRSEAGARATVAHTGAIAGSSRAFDALLRAYGAIAVEDFVELVEVLELLGRARRPRGPRVAAISESGGEAALLADRGEEAGIAFAPLPEELAAKLRERFPNYLSPGNPLDAWAVADVGEVFPESLELLGASGRYDVLLAQVDHAQYRGAWEQEWVTLIVRALADVADATGVFPAVTTIQGGDPLPAVAALARERDVALLRGSRAAMRALAAVAAAPPPRPRAADAGPVVEIADLATTQGPLPEHESAAILERYGVPVAARRRAPTPVAAAAAADELGYPVVVKRDGPAHKAAEGGVVLGVASADEAAAAAERLGGRVLVAEQRRGGLEALCGLVRDEAFGPVLAVGVGGALAESLSLAALALGPLDREQALGLVREAPGLAAVASEPAQSALADVLVALGRIAAQHPEVVEIDVNPLILDEHGAVAVDALVVVAPERS